MVRSALLSQFPELIHGISERDDGGMSLRFRGDRALENRRRFFQKLGIDLFDVVSADQKHTRNIAIVERKHRSLARENETPFTNVDGLVTAEPEIFLAIFTADCLPIMLYDPLKKIVGLIHAGWRGTVAEIARRGVRKMVELGAKPADIRAFIGPSIGGCHYDIDFERVKKLKRVRPWARKRAGKWYLDLWKANTVGLLGAGLSLSHIENARLCTAEGNRFFSWHRDREAVGGTIVAVIGRKGQ